MCPQIPRENDTLSGLQRRASGAGLTGVAGGRVHVDLEFQSFSGGPRICSQNRIITIVVH